MGVPLAVAVGVGEGFREEIDARGAAQNQIIDRGAGLHAHHVVQHIARERRVGHIRENDLGLASVGTEFGRAGDADKGLGARVGFDQTDRVEFAVVREGVGDLQCVQEFGHIVVHVGQRNGQLVEGVVDVVIDGEIVAALHHRAAVGAALGAGDAEGEALLERGEVGAVGQGLREVDLHRVVVVDPVGVTLRPRDVDALVGAIRVHVADNLGDMCVGGSHVDVAHRGSLDQTDRDGRSSRSGVFGGNIVIAEAPLFFVGQVDGRHLSGLSPRLRQGVVVLAVRIDVRVFLAGFAGAVLVGIDERLEAGTVAVENFGHGVVVAVVAVGDVEPDFLDGQIGVEHEFVARAADRVAIVGREQHLAGGRGGIIVEDLREGLVERSGGVRIAVEVGAGAQDVETFAQACLRGERPVGVRDIGRRGARVVVVREEDFRRRIEIAHAEGGHHVFLAGDLRRAARPLRGGAGFVEADLVGDVGGSIGFGYGH